MKKNNTSLLFDMLTNFPKFEHVFNPLVDFDPVNDASPTAPSIRLNQLQSYINMRVDTAKVVLIAEGESYKGAKFTGIAMTDERVLLGLKKTAPFKQSEVIDIEARSTSMLAASKPGNSMNEMTCSVLYNFLYRQGVDPRSVVTWNAFPFHPHKPGQALSNRAPKIAEIEAAYHIHREFFDIFPDCRVIAIGNYAAELMADMRMPYEQIRHPAFGGAKKFTEFMKSKMARSDHHSQSMLEAR